MTVPDEQWDDLSDVHGWLKQAGTKDARWLGLTARLLEHCYRHPPSLDVWGNRADDVLDAITVVRTQAHELIVSWSDAPAIPTEIRDALCVLLAESADQVRDSGLPSAVVARGLAEAVEELHGHRFISEYATRAWHKSRDPAGHSMQLKQGCAFPVMTWNPKPYLGDHDANTNPARIPSRLLHEMLTLRVADDAAAQYQFVMDFSLSGHLSELSPGVPLKVAAVGVNHSLDEFSGESGTPTSLRNLGPIDEERQIRLLLDAIRAAHQDGAQVVVLPEYSLTQSGAVSLNAQLDMLESRPQLVVAGTYIPGVDPAIGSNEAVLLVGGLPSTHVEKQFKAVIGGAGEAIRAGEEVRVFVGEEWTVGVLICVDAMSSQLVEQLAKMGVNLLLVPAMSPKTTSLVRQAVRLVSESQAIVTIANSPTEWVGGSVAKRDRAPRGTRSRSEAAFDAPYGAYTAPVLCPDPADGRPIPPVGAAGCWVFDVAKRSGKWVFT